MSSTSAAIRSSDGSGICSGWRPSRSRNASWKFMATWPRRSAELPELALECALLLLQLRQPGPLTFDDLLRGLRHELGIAESAPGPRNVPFDLGEALAKPPHLSAAVHERRR